MRTRLTIIAAVAAAVMTPTLVASARPAPSQRLTPAGDSTQNDYFVPLAGSDSTLVLTRQPRLPRDVNLSASADARFSSAPDQIYVRPASGGLTKLALRPDLAETFSLVGSTLAAGLRVDDDVPVTDTAYVWSTTTGKRHIIALPDDAVYLAAAPDGVLFATPAGDLRIRTVSGTTTTLATPFGANAKLIAAAVDDDGAVVSDDAGHVAFVTFTAPAAVTSLQNPTGDPVACYQVAGDYAACATAAYDEDLGAYTPSTPVLVPLDGSAPTVDATPGDCPAYGDYAVAGSTELWTCENVDASWPYPFHLQSLAAGSATPVLSTAALGSALVSAYGKAVGVSANGESLYQATSAVTGAALIPVTPSPVAVDAFQLTSHRLIYSDNQRISGRDGELESVLVRTINATRSAVHISSPRVVGREATGIAGNLIGVSKAVKVYATYAGAGHSIGNAILHVLGRHRTKTIHHVVGQGQVQVSGTRVLYQDWNGSKSHVEVYDDATGKTVIVHTVNGLDYHGYALAGHHVAYATKHGAIYRVNLTSGKRVLLRKALPHDAGGVEFDVYAAGHWVGWHALPVQRELAHPLNQIRNVKTMAPIVSVRHTLYSLTSAGAILSSTHATFRRGFNEVGQVTHATRFWLRDYSGHTRSLLPKANYISGPQVAGRVLAWGDANGVLRARML